jgi:hypothetical protein
MVKEVYDVSQTLTPAQIATALYFRDQPGFQAAHITFLFSARLCILKTLNWIFMHWHMLKQELLVAESMINCWKIKYEVLLDRPIRYIREVLGHTGWNPVFTTPAILIFLQDIHKMVAHLLL